ncbi:MAG: DUF1848 domain-containing protein [Candidatus Omnitrophica bacterium]|nr:DUF1848 domain-containing protein [Candidatus Omnitrophota bacterium]
MLPKTAGATEPAVISVSRRTDIPAFYAQWFIERVRAGFCTVPNPFNSRQPPRRIDLRPEAVRAFVFWTRDARPLLPYLPELDRRGYRYYFLYTLTGYPRILEPACPERAGALETLRQLARHVGPQRLIWRYDPVLFSNYTPPEWHRDNLNGLFPCLEGVVERMIFSVIEPYRKTVRRLRAETAADFVLYPDAFTVSAYEDFIGWMALAAARFGIQAENCAQAGGWSAAGVGQSQCINAPLIHALSGSPVSDKKDPGQRRLCRCTVSLDIGMADTCLFGCVYCYATRSRDYARKRYASHRPQGESLCPHVF